MRYERLLKKLNDFGELVMLKHSLFSLSFILTAMITASKLLNGTAWFGWRLLLLAILGAFFARNFAMAVNRFFDRDIDMINPRTKTRPSVDGRIDTKEMLVFIVVNAALFVIVTYFVNPLAFMLSFPFLIVLGVYTFFKRFSATAHLFLGVSLGLAPITGAIAVTGEFETWSIWLGIGVAFWVSGFDLLYSLQDMAFDKEHGLYSIPVKFGVKTTLAFASLFHLLAVVFWLIYVNSVGFGLFGYLAVIVSAAMLIYEHYLVRKDLSQIDKAFFMVNAYLGIVFLFFILAEVW